MPLWLQQTFGPWPDITPLALTLRLLGALVFGFLTALLYRATKRAGVIPAAFPSTLVLLAVLIAMVTQVIGDQIARAFSLVGALSIVRFRTVVDDTHDIAFVILAVVVGMAIGANHWLVAAIGFVVVAFAAFVMAPRSPQNIWSAHDALLMVRLGIGRNPEEVLRPILLKYVVRYELHSGATSRQGTTIDFTYRMRLRPECQPDQLVGEVNALDGVQGVEIKRD